MKNKKNRQELTSEEYNYVLLILAILAILWFLLTSAIPNIGYVVGLIVIIVAPIFFILKNIKLK